MDRENFLLYGAGNIAVQIDEGDNDTCRSLAKGILQHGKKIIGYLDTNEDCVSHALKLYGGQAFSHLDKDLMTSKVDYVVISTPDQYHYEHAIEMLDNNISGLFIEKPMAMNSQEAYKIIEIAKRRKIRITVNYFRRFLPEFMNLKNQINKEFLGSFLFGRGIYDKGLFHNGSHLIDLIIYLFGNVEVNYVFKKRKSTLKNDDNYSFELTTLQGESSITINYGKSECYTQFDLELYFEHGAIKINDFGQNIEYYKVEDSNIKGYKKLEKKEIVCTSYMQSSYYSIKSFLENQSYKHAYDACKVIEICEKVVRLYEDTSSRT